VTDRPYVLRPNGWVESPLVDAATAPKQGIEGAPEAWIAFDEDVLEALRDLREGDEVFILT
jgi:tRNA (Thr-GGU) A37 N-methylase